MSQFQLGAGLVPAENGDQLVQWNIASQPVNIALVLDHEAMAAVLDWANAHLPDLIDQARRANAMKGFQIVGEVPASSLLRQVFDPNANGGPQHG